MRIPPVLLGTAVLALTAALSLPAQAAPTAGSAPATAIQPAKQTLHTKSDRKANAVSWVQLRNHGTQGKFCLAVPGADRRPGIGLIQFGCGPWVDHKWGFEARPDRGSRVFRIISKNPSVNNKAQCVSIPGGSTQAGVQAHQWECGEWPDHFWTITDRTGAGDYRIRNLKSGQCLGVDANSHTAGARVIQWPCKTGGGDHPDHLWYLTAS
ncbi:RICIN domain-containing protein [Streptomyces sp. S1]|uniref:RICIN domain-containing protein n=1 Tax=Streptomyces sp. S1 TaxID=718288 RepID=UPI003D76208D